MLPDAGRRPAVERAHIVVVEQRLNLEREALLLQRGQILQEANAAARAEPFVARQQQDVSRVHCSCHQRSRGEKSSAS